MQINLTSGVLTLLCKLRESERKRAREREAEGNSVTHQKWNSEDMLQIERERETEGKGIEENRKRALGED